MVLRLSIHQADVSLSPIPFATAGQEQVEREGRTLVVTRSALQSNRIQRCKAECKDCRGFSDPLCKAYNSRSQIIPAFSHKPEKALTISIKTALSGEQRYIQLQFGWMDAKAGSISRLTDRKQIIGLQGTSSSRILEAAFFKKHLNTEHL